MARCEFDFANLKAVYLRCESCDKEARFILGLDEIALSNQLCHHTKQSRLFSNFLRHLQAALPNTIFEDHTHFVIFHDQRLSSLSLKDCEIDLVASAFFRDRLDIGYSLVCPEGHTTFLSPLDERYQSNCGECTAQFPDKFKEGFKELRQGLREVKLPSNPFREILRILVRHQLS